jgi:hypothetical protein
MKVSIKDLSVSMDIKNNGIELDVYDGDDRHLGDLIVSKAGITWCQGKTRRQNGKRLSWNQFIQMMNRS